MYFMAFALWCELGVAALKILQSEGVITLLL